MVVVRREAAVDVVDLRRRSLPRPVTNQNLKFLHIQAPPQQPLQPACGYHNKMLGKRKPNAAGYAPSKRKKLQPVVEEVAFDFAAREDYLTGFHKRKLQRIKHAQEEAAKRERTDRITARKLVCKFACEIVPHALIVLL